MQPKLFKLFFCVFIVFFSACKSKDNIDFEPQPTEFDTAQVTTSFSPEAIAHGVIKLGCKTDCAFEITDAKPPITGEIKQFNTGDNTFKAVISINGKQYSVKKHNHDDDRRRHGGKFFTVDFYHIVSYDGTSSSCYVSYEKTGQSILQITPKKYVFFSKIDGRKISNSRKVISVPLQEKDFLFVNEAIDFDGPNEEDRFELRYEDGMLYTNFDEGRANYPYFLKDGTRLGAYTIKAVEVEYSFARSIKRTCTTKLTSHFNQETPESEFSLETLETELNK